MRKILAIAIGILTAGVIFGQNFEGKVSYENTIKSKNPAVTDQQFMTMLGTKQEYFIKGGNYKSVTNGTFILWQVYINKDNKIYNKFANSEALLWNDCGTQGDTILSYKINKGVVDILGYKCDELVLICTSGIQKYYFNTKLGIDPQLYVNHKYSNWYDYLKLSKAVPLKMYIDNAQMTMESIATEVKPMKLDDKQFQLPADVKTMKSPY